MYLNFYIGPNPSVPKRTRIVLPIEPKVDFELNQYQWDARLIIQEPRKITVEVRSKADDYVNDFIMNITENI